MNFVIVRQSDPETPLERFTTESWEEARAFLRRREHVFDDECLRRAEALDSEPPSDVVKGVNDRPIR